MKKKFFHPLLRTGGGTLKALAMAALAFVGSQGAMAQETYISNPGTMKPGYYYMVYGKNTSMAMAVNQDKKAVIETLDKDDLRFVWYVTGFTGTAAEEDGTKTIAEMVDGQNKQRIRLYWGNPTWSTNGTIWALPGAPSANGPLDNINKEVGASAFNEQSDYGFRFRLSNSKDLSPQTDSDTPPEGDLMCSYNGRTDNNRYHASYKFVAVSDEVIARVKATTPETIISDYIASKAVPEAIAAYEQMMTYVNNIGTEVGKYNITLTSEQSELTDSKYAEKAGYSGLDTDAVNAKRDAFLALIPKIQWTYVSGLPEVSIVTLQWNGGGRYNGINSSTSDGNFASANGLGSPDGVNGRVALLKQEDGKFLLSTRGAYLKNTSAAVSKDNATRYAIIGTFESGLTIMSEDGLYLTGSSFTTQTEMPTTNFKVNTFDKYDRVGDANNSSDDGKGNYANAYCYPFKVKKPEGEGFHTYVVKVVDGELQTEDVDVVPAGVPFIYVRNTDADPARRMYIPQEDQEYVDAPLTTTLLRGFYFRDQREDAKFYLGVRDGVFGFYNQDNTGTETNRAYITAEAAAALSGAKLFQLIDGKLVVTQAHEVTYKLQDKDGNELKSFSNDEVPHGADATQVPEQFKAGYTTVTKTDGPDVINEDATVVFTATWDNLPFELGKFYNFILRASGDNVKGIFYAQSGSTNNVKKADLKKANLLTDQYQWQFTGTPYAIKVTSKDGKVITLTDGSNNATLVDGGDFTFTLSERTATEFQLIGNGISGNNNYFGDYGNADVMGCWSQGDPGTFLRVAELPVPVTATITAAGYATFGHEKAVDFSEAEGLTVLTAKYADGKITYAAVEKKQIPAEGAVILQGDAGEYTGYEIAEANALENNDLKVDLTQDITSNGTYYCLANKSKGVGFYKVASGTIVKKGKAYLEITDDTTDAKDFYGMDGNATGINALETENAASGAVYNLAGQRVAKAQKGLYIQNGKKIVIR